ncbi:hypothetical protein H5410_001944 [Solanum commersonii]|uniref:Uncharacterized protein n=1 Tax=Solanum commersonii TaxID=4109 RepID=A0A9J6B104_SOLCO|nr:hypothetical protein H5410_001944 [Solanum commersonii]
MRQRAPKERVSIRPYTHQPPGISSIGSSRNIRIQSECRKNYLSLASSIQQQFLTKRGGTTVIWEKNQNEYLSTNNYLN